MSEPDLNLLIALDILLAEANVTVAARRLGLSTSAMSRTLARLRETIGDPLLVRAGRNMVLTPHAEALRDRVNSTANDARALLSPTTVPLDLATLQRTFDIRANDGFVEVLGPALISAIAADAPLVKLRFAPKLEKTATYLRDGSADLEIGVMSNMGPEVRVQALFRDRFVGVVRKGHPFEKVRKITPKRYAEAGHVVASRRGYMTGPLDAALEKLGLTRNVMVVVPSFPAAIAIARSTELVALVPASYRLAVPKSKKDATIAATTYAFELPVVTPPITISQMWHPRFELDAVHQWLRQIVLKVCRERVSD